MLKPGDLLERTIRVVQSAFQYAGVPYWLGFGGLWGLIQNEGVVPDSDLDYCTYYGGSYERLVKSMSMSPGRYTATRVLLDDTNPSAALYAGFNSSVGYPHICVSFWYKHKGIRYYCHDQRHEVQGVKAPPGGYWFRGVPAEAVDGDEMFRMVEWPGINQQFKVRVPRFPGVILDHCYPDWPYRKQRYNIQEHKIQKDKMASYHKGGATSPYAVYVKSMRQWRNEAYIQNQLAEGRQKWNTRLKMSK
jgi:hypothetical protein